MSGKGRTMTAVALAVGQRTAAWLRQQYPNAHAKRIARDFNVDERTAKSWLAGKPPSTDYWHSCVARWGKGFVAFVYAPYFDWAEQARLEVEIETIQSRLDELREKVRPQNGPSSTNAGDPLPASREQTGEARHNLAAQSRKIDP
jgi:hypothetical protein